MSETVTASQYLDELLQAVRDLPPSFTILLDPPIKFQGGEFAQLVLREPKADEARQAEEHLRVGTPSGRRNYQMHLVHKVADVPLPVVQQIGVAKLQAAMVYLNLFLGIGPGTGVS